MIGVVCGLASEADVVRDALGETADVRISGASAARAEELAENLIASGARELWSIGVSGGLVQELTPGALVIGGKVATPDGPAIPCTPSLVDKMRHALGAEVTIVTLAGSDELASRPAEKADLAHRLGADAVDMESHAVARVAQRSGTPFAALRAIADAAGDTLPAVAAQAVGVDGKPQIGAVLSGLARRPGDLPGLIALGRASAKAHAALRRGMLVLYAAGVFAR